MILTFELPNKDVVYYQEEKHRYYVNGIMVPSITQLVEAYFGNIYGDIPEDVLQRAAEYGTAVHQEIQANLEGNTIEVNYVETDNFLNVIAPRLYLEPIQCEQIVVIYDKRGAPIAAGRYDLLAYTTEQKIKTLIDFKTTSTLHRQQVIFQLNLYKRGAYQSQYLTKEEYEKILLNVVQLKHEIKKSEYLPNLPDSTLDKMIDKALENYYIDKEMEGL